MNADGSESAPFPVVKVASDVALAVVVFTTEAPRIQE
jgi:hypothetical protein